MSEWYSIEVFDGASSAALWADTHADAILESALSSGAKDWSWHRHPWGVVLELEFADAKSWDSWRALAQVQAALDAVPDPVSGLIVYRGRGGTSSAGRPRRPRPLQGSGSAALPLPWEFDDEGPALLPGWPRPLFASPPVGAGAARHPFARKW
ncbi:MAG: hypothetical protein ACRDZX_03910 [Acidimicrobiales bacterium]